MTISMTNVRVTFLFPLLCYFFGQLSQAALDEGQPCDPDKFRWHRVEDDPFKFLHCDTQLRTLKINNCPEVDGVKLYFDEKENRCLGPRQRNKRTPGIPKSSNVMEACTFNTDCKDNMYCPSGTCQCNPGYVGTSGASSCLPAINPGQNGCSQDLQCAAGWPGATCQSNICTCPTGYFVVQTQDGAVCVFTANCPLPDYGTTAVATTIIQLSNNNGGAVDACTYGSTDDGSGAAPTATRYCHNGDTANIYQGDMYDCIPSAPPGTPEALPTEGSAGICCPSRSLTCIQPKVPATAASTGATSNRYWYNSITGGCEPFLFSAGANEGNSNSFLSPEFCLSYCGTACDHGPPLLRSQTTTPLNRATVCSTSTDCATTFTGQSYTCTQTGSTSTCCASTSFVCSNFGGRQVYAQGTAAATSGPVLVTPDPGTISFPALSATFPNTVARWFYNTVTGQCQQFNYLGNAGNWNNFLSQSDCTQFCVASVCEQGIPLKTAQGANQACSGGRGCPTTYECRSNICCPRKQTVCIQPRSAGSCSSIIPSYWFNSATGDCESFQYTGCGGNDNNFLSYSTCITYCRDIRAEPRCIQGDADKDSTGKYLTCTTSGGSSTCRANYECYFDGTIFGCCAVRSYTCALSRNVGTACITAGGRWYYDTTVRSCQAFTYNGCDGNTNNFINRDDCERYCGAGGCPYGGTAAVDASNTRRTCSSTAATCPTSYECQTITLSGSSLNACCLTRTAICQENPIQGSTSGAQTTRYYFNPSLRSCTSFTFFGTGGNENNFNTLAQCTNFCSSAACGLGQTVALDGNQRVITCNQQITTSCPTGYQCRQDTLFNRFVCCGSSDMGVCPTGEIAFIDAYTQLPRECRVGLTGDCYSNYLCRQNTARNRNYCCAPAAGTFCPSGRALARDPTTQQPQSCFLSALNPCSAGYTCQSTTTGQVQGYCCTINSVCPGNTDFATDGNQNPRTCIMPAAGGTNPCPDQFTCQSSTAGSSSGFCCRIGGTTAFCGTLTPVVDPTTNNARLCSGTVACPSGTCTANAQNGLSYCCLQTTTGIDPDGCGVGLIAYRETTTNVIRQCTVGSINNCPSGFSCQSTPTFAQNRCCGLSSGCPVNSAAFVNPATGGAQSCTGGITCQSGFSCTTTASFGSICCSSGQIVSNLGVCPAGSPLSAGATFQTCSDIIACPANYECLPTSQGLLCCPSRISTCSQPLQVGTSCTTSASQTRFYYDSSSGLCNQFQFNGCSGNDNSFATLQSCDLFCARGICQRGEPARLGSSYQFCSGGAGCSTGYQCATPRYGPTANQVCCPTTTSSCSQGQDSGSSCGSAANVGINRYSYNTASLSCTVFPYFGCGGNGNNFASLSECQTSCQTTVGTVRCPLPTQTPYIPAGGTTPQTCNPGPCPANYQCVNSGRGFICCSTQSSMCPSGSVVATSAVTGAAINCMTTTCQTGYRCTYSQSYRFYYCCSGGTTVVTTSNVCPNGQAAYFTPGSATPARCSQTVATGGVGACPPSYSCLQSSRYATTICCRTTAAQVGVSSVITAAVSNDCSIGSPTLFRGTNLAIGCNGSTDTRCPSGSTCLQRKSNPTLYQCCVASG